MIYLRQFNIHQNVKNAFHHYLRFALVYDLFVAVDAGAGMFPQEALATPVRLP